MENNLHYNSLFGIQQLIKALEYASNNCIDQCMTNPYASGDSLREWYLGAEKFLADHIIQHFIIKTKEVTVLMVNDFPLGAYETEDKAKEAGKAFSKAYDDQRKGTGWQSNQVHHFHCHTYQVNTPPRL